MEAPQLNSSAFAMSDVRSILSEDFSETTVNRVVMALRMGSRDSDFIELAAVRPLLEEDFSKSDIDRVVMALTLIPSPPTD